MVARHWFQHYVRETDFLVRYPFYAGVLSQLEFVSTTAVPVMAVRWCAGRFQLLVNEEFFAAQPHYRAGVLLHEVHHLVLGHLTRRTFFDVARPDLMQLAMEVAANEYINEPLPQPIVWQTFNKCGLHPHQTTMLRYELLHAEEHNIAPRLLRQPTLDLHDGAAGAIGISDVVHGRALPGCATAALAVLLRRAQAMTANSLGELAVRAARQKARESPPKDKLREVLDRLLDEGPRPSGLLGRDVDAVIAELTPDEGNGRIDWRTALREFASRGPRVDWQRPNRRQPHRLLEVPGRSWRGALPEIVCAIDTSASMAARDLNAIGRELRPLSSVARLTIVECDETIRRVYPFAGQLSSVSGRGGTDLRPPFAAALIQRHGRDGLVYFTDGQGPLPVQSPGVPVLWIITSRAPFAPPFGRRVDLRVASAEPDDLDSVQLPF